MSRDDSAQDVRRRAVDAAMRVFERGLKLYAPNRVFVEEAVDAASAVYAGTIAAAMTTEFTWRHNRFIGERDATADRVEAERNVERCRAANPGDDIGLVTRLAGEWREVRG